MSTSNLEYVLETAKDIGENLPEAKSTIRKAGYLLFNLISLHPFLDGNKRTALEVTKNFLQLNGWILEPSEEDAFNTVVSIAKGALDAESAEKWIARNLSRRGGEE